MSDAHTMRLQHTQRGVALFTALIFLVVITIISLAGIRSSTMELHMASNEQERRLGLDSTQSASDVVIEKANIPITTTGATTCVGFGYTPAKTIDGSACGSAQNLTTGPGVSDDNFVQLTQLYIGTCPPFVRTGERASGGTGANCAYFTLDSTYDATDKRGGRSGTVEGVVMESF